jgi:hypothetical protein
MISPQAALAWIERIDLPAHGKKTLKMRPV